MNTVDTNVLIYAYDESSPAKRHLARELLTRIADGVLLWQVACEFVAASRRSLAPGAAPDAIRDRLDEIRESFPLVIPTATALARARVLQVDGGVSFWDALIYAACLEAGATRLYSEDIPGRAIDGLEIINPFA